MKRKEIVRALLEAGFELKEGRNHTLIYDKAGNRVSALGRHGEIPDAHVRTIEKQIGAKLRKG